MLIDLRVREPLAPLGSLYFGYKNLSRAVKWQAGCRFFFFLIKKEEKFKQASISLKLRYASGSDCGPTVLVFTFPPCGQGTMLLYASFFTVPCISVLDAQAPLSKLGEFKSNPEADTV